MTLNPRTGLLVAALQLGACASLPQDEGPVWPYPEPPETDSWGYAPQPQAKEPVRDYQAPAREDVRHAEPAVSGHPTVQALVRQADEERARGELDRAAATLERAIRIVNNDPLPWLKLAELRFEQGNLVQAETLARRSLSFASSGPSARDSWLLIADVKRLQGDTAAAQQARDRALSI